MLRGLVHMLRPMQWWFMAFWILVWRAFIPKSEPKETWGQLIGFILRWSFWQGRSKPICPGSVVFEVISWKIFGIAEGFGSCSWSQNPQLVLLRVKQRPYGKPSRSTSAGWNSLMTLEIGSWQEETEDQQGIVDHCEHLMKSKLLSCCHPGLGTFWNSFFSKITQVCCLRPLLCPMSWPRRRCSLWHSKNWRVSFSYTMKRCPAQAEAVDQWLQENAAGTAT